ncbi:MULTISPECIES: hypothetical protein [unclassified Thermosynechococcus]|uniref:hypothetical protein n=1 Tax=unclassified Thermosynechococcus TaxID=2622553 RepID=UPI0026718E2D|nr:MULTISPECIES: hypothetical protein [unclassified Thermosynechococcus]WKT83277.1 hypothetical protein QYC28_10705 [Thermosynechococcus sp. HY596]WNC62406.1 hypothetical protein RHK13_10700 [Thermosynechococcus sp. HY591]WNC64961.1 hypothetical protein RHK28_10735 [Thermosynechococcus sp. HY593]
MRFSSIPWIVIASMLPAVPVFANSAAIGTIQVSPELRSVLQSAPDPTANPNAVQPASNMAEIENSLEISPVPTRPDPKVYRQFEEPRNNRGLGFKVGI